MDKRQFDEAIGTVPPSTVDVDAVIARQRRAAVARRVAGSWLVAAAAVVAVTVGIATMLPGGSGTTQGPGGQPGADRSTDAATRTATPSAAQPGVGGPCAEGTPTAPPAPEQPAVAAARLQQVLSAAVQPRLPAGGRLEASPVARYDGGRQYGPLEFLHAFRAGEAFGSGCAAPEDHFLARATLVDPAGAGNLMAFVGRLGGVNELITECTGGFHEQTSCHRQEGPNGEIVVATVLALEGGAAAHRVDVSKPDGTGVIVTAENVAGSAKNGGPAQRTSPPLTLEQLTAIALEPGMTLYP